MVRNENAQGLVLQVTYGYDEGLKLSNVALGPTGGATATLTMMRDPDSGTPSAPRHYNGLLWTTNIGSGSSTVSDTRTYNPFGELATYAAKQGSITAFQATYDDGTSTGRRDGLGRVRQLAEVMTTSTTTVSGTSVNTTQAMTYQDGRLKEVDIGGSAVEVYTYGTESNLNQLDYYLRESAVAPELRDSGACTVYGESTEPIASYFDTNNLQDYLSSSSPAVIASAFAHEGGHAIAASAGVPSLGHSLGTILQILSLLGRN